MTHLVKTFQPVFFFCLLAFFVGCTGGEPVAVNFVLNNQDIQPATVQPTELSDTASLLTVNVGDSIYLVDFSEPLGAVKSRSWDISGDGISDVEDAESLYIAISESGFNKVTLCVNGPENCVSKWIHAKSDRVPTPHPELTVMNHSGATITVPTKKFHLEVETENVESKDQLIIEVNNEVISEFDFTDNLLVADLRLPEHINYVNVIAETDNDREIVTLTVENLQKKRKEPRVSNPSPAVRPSPVTRPAPPPPPAPPRPQIVLKQPAQLTAKTPTNSYPVVMQTKNIKNRAELIVTVNGQPHQNFSFSGNEISFTAPLKQERNVVVVATTNGRVKRELMITRETTKPEPRVVVVPSPPPPPDPKGGVAWGGPGKLSQSALGNCTSYSINSGMVRLSPKKQIYLLGVTVYASSCGSITFTLSQNKSGTNGKTEIREVKEGLNVITFDVISDSQLATSEYYLGYVTGTSTNCGQGTPQLLDGGPCGKTSSGDSRVALRYDQSAVGIFQFKYEY